MAVKQRVMVGMSGGVDSSVAAALLLEHGYEVAGATFLLWGNGDDAVVDARRVCDHIGIPHYVMDYRALFREHVMDPFSQEYQNGRTPNPCILCNRNIKFGAFLRDAVALGYEYISTGHYAQIESGSTTGRIRLCRAHFHRKDQSYVLYMLTQPQLSALILPLSSLEKLEVRSIAENLKLPVAQKSESQDICFIPDGDYASFLERHTGSLPHHGDFLDADGHVIGTHRGAWRYTIGQRKGLGVGFGKPVYVQSVDTEKNTVTLGENEALFRSELIASELNWIDFDRLEAPCRFQARIRYLHTPAGSTVTPSKNDTVHVLFDEPQRAITKGQAVVFYDGEYVVGGGTING